MDEASIAMMLQALEDAAYRSAVNIPGFDESTRVLLASDTSGSMCRPVSRNSSVQCYHIGLLLSMLMKHRCPQAVTGMFADIWKAYSMPSTNVLQNTMDMIDREGEVGYATNGHKVIDWLIAKHRVMDKVMIFTDCQMWDSDHYYLGYNEKEIKDSWHTYKSMFPEAKLYLFDLAGYGQMPLSLAEKDVYLIAGWSDRVFEVLSAIDNGEDALSVINKIDV